MESSQPVLRGQREPIFVFSISRGGSNLFAALLHNHDQIFSIPHGEAHAALNQKPTADDIRRLPLDYSTSIYPSGGPAKDLGSIKYVLFDKVEWRPDCKDEDVQHAISLIKQGVGRGIVLIRNPFAVLSSMHSFAKRWGRKLWEINSANLDLFFRHTFAPQLALTHNNRFYVVSYERFIHDLDAEYEQLCRWLELEFMSRYTSFEDTFNHVGSKDGGLFGSTLSSSFASSYLKSISAEIPPDTVYCCTKTGEQTIGYGLFNPYHPIDRNRMHTWKGSLQEEDKASIRKVMRNYIDGQGVAFFENVDVPTQDDFTRIKQRKTLGAYRAATRAVAAQMRAKVRRIAGRTIRKVLRIDRPIPLPRSFPWRILAGRDARRSRERDGQT